MSRRVKLPGASELFRPTGTETPAPTGRSDSAETSDRPADQRQAEQDGAGSSAGGTGRVRHEEKITVYVTADELVDLEHARLELRRSHRISSDRGRIVREAIAIVLADLNLNGEDSVLVDRLRSR